ncbi:MAG: hypothetical protein F7C35_05155 [Desulfurococcales archaeon]|nr:hypothetical protein [Desulfurococcales archaeon]
MSECDREKLEALMSLAKLWLPEDEACKYISDMERLTSTLQAAVRKYGVEEPLYYVWEEGYEPLEEPISHGGVDIRGLTPDRVDDEGRVVLPWKPRG